MMEDMFSFQDIRVLEEELETHRGSTYSANRLLSLLEAEDLSEIEEALDAVEKYEVTLEISDLAVAQPTGNDGLRLKQEAEFASLEQICVGLEANDPLVLYLQELAETPVAGDLQQYAQRYLEGEHHLAETMLTMCLRLVGDVALEFTGYGLLLMDLIQEGNLGLWECLPSYEGGDFQAFATRWIRRYLIKAVVRNAHSCGVGRMVRQNVERYLKTDRELLISLGRNPTRQEIAEAMGLEQDEILTLEKMIEEARQQESVKQQADAPETTPEDDLAVEDTAYFQLRQTVTELLSTLSEQESKLLNLRFGLSGGKPMTPEQAGRELGMTPAEVVAAEASALAKLRTQ